MNSPIADDFLEQISADVPDDDQLGLDAFGWAMLRGLAKIKASYPAQWTDVAASIRRFPIAARLRESPLTARSADKPRGYPGDAVMMDLIYRLSPAPAGTTSFGAHWFDYELRSIACRAARERLRYTAKTIRHYATSRRDASVLSLASGHCRELDMLKKSELDQIDFTALDQDRESLSFVTQRLGPSIKVLNDSIHDFIRWDTPMRFDLIYALGLFDYLDDFVAKKLASKAFSLLRPGGELLIGNYHPSLIDTAYMEAIMDWWLLYRNEDDLDGLVADLATTEAATKDVFCDPLGAVTYLRVMKPC